MNAGTALSELNRKLPKQDGVLQSIFGEKDMAKFGTQLSTFGEKFAEYSGYMKQVDAGVVITTTNAADSIVKLADSLPENKLFSSETTLDEFGRQLSLFGSYFAMYYNSVSGINTFKLSSIIDELWRLVNLANGMATVDASGMSSFGSSLTKLGKTGIEGFLSAFEGANGKIRDTVDTMLTTFIRTAESYSSKFSSAFSKLMSTSLKSIEGEYGNLSAAGRESMIRLTSGVQEKEVALKATITSIMEETLLIIKQSYLEFSASGIECMTRFISGVESKRYDFSKAFSLSDALKGIRGEYASFYNAGAYLADGFADGISSRTWAVEAKAKAMAKAAERAAEKELDINSPSKVGYRIGDFFGLGFVNAIGDYVDKSYDSSSKMAESAREGLTRAVSSISSMIEDGIDSQPTIRPVLDLSGIKDGASKLNTLFSANQAMSISTTMSRGMVEEDQNGPATRQTESVFNFTQNNYSPKALSRVEIYRQTKNQFSALKGMVKT